MPLRYFLPLFAVELLLMVPSVWAQTNPALVGSCQPGQAHSVLDIGNVRAHINNDGGQFYPNTGDSFTYEIPKGSGLNAHFADGLFVGGIIDGELRVTGSNYGPSEFWPGPLPLNGIPTDCAIFDRIYTVESSDLAEDGTPTVDMLEWPAHLGAPYHDVDGITGYDPLSGDRPKIRGDQYLWWISNDAGNVHEETLSNPLRIEVINEAWAFEAVGDVGNTTFFRHSIINKGADLIQDAYVGLYADVDLGSAFDDYPGSDSSLSLAYMYNADDDDDDQYGPAPPAFGFTLLEASHSSGGLPTDVGADPSAFLTSIISPEKSGGPFYEYPGTAERMYRFLQGRSPVTDLPMYAWGYPWENKGPETNYAYHGDPVTGRGWSALNIDGQGTAMAPKDNRIMGSHGPFDLAPGDSASFTFAYVWGRGLSNLDSVSKLKSITSYLHHVKDALNGPRRPPAPRFIDGNPPEAPQFPFWVDEPWPNPASDRLSLSYSLPLDGPVTVRVFDRLGRVRLLQEFTTSNGPDLINLDISSLQSGAYSLSLDSRSHHADHSFVVIR